MLCGKDESYSNLAQSHWGPASLWVAKIYLLNLSSFEHCRVVKAKEIISPPSLKRENKDNHLAVKIYCFLRNMCMISLGFPGSYTKNLLEK